MKGSLNGHLAQKTANKELGKGHARVSERQPTTESSKLRSKRQRRGRDKEDERPAGPSEKR